MEDENDLYESGLEDESMDTMPAGEVDVIAQSPLSIASAQPESYRERLRERLLSSIDTSEAEAKQYGETLAKIEEAKKNLLQAPDRRQYLQGLASKLTAPRTEADPRFFERRNLFTFLRDVGEYGQEQKAAEKERQAKLIQLQELQARYGLEEAQKRRGRAEQLAAQYLSREPAQAGQRTGSSEFERLLENIPEDQRESYQRARLGMLTERQTAAPKVDTLAQDYEIVFNSEKYPPNVVAAAQARIEKSKPADVRKNERAEAAKENLYKSRITRQARVVIPDIDRAIKILDENPNISAGNFSNWIVDLPVFGQQAKDLDSLLQSVRAAVGFGQLEDLKLMSPTGASGLGAVSNFEQQVLQSVEGSLARDMSAPNLKMNLERLKNFYEVDLPAFLESKGINLSGIGGRPAEGEKSPAQKAREEIEKREALKKGGG